MNKLVGDQTVPNTPVELQVMTFNLRTHTANDAGNEWINRSPLAGTVIHAHHPTIFGVQEAYLMMLDDLQAQLPEYSWIGEGRQGGSQDEHCAIFYQHDELQLIEQGQFWLSETPNIVGSLGWDSDYPRICTWGRFTHRASGRTIRIYNTHLDHIGERARIEGIKLIISIMQQHKSKYPDSAGMLIGDMNGSPGDVPLRYLHGELPNVTMPLQLVDAYASFSGMPGRTFHDFRGGQDGEPIDYIFVEKPLQVQQTSIDRRSFAGKYPSDHYPIIANLTFSSIGVSM